ncbi:MAG: hypothetical protein K2I42_05630 [Anaeroplasmataceae bacterium]|nr:hypothetical protein [Anaeroplasmataceae bacterium]
MKEERYFKNDFMNMDSMHDSYANEAKIENGCLIIIYDKLDEGVLAPDGNPYYKNKKLTIKYNFETDCEAKFYYNKNKVIYVDLIDNIDLFIKITKNCLFRSYKYSLDCFGEIILDFSLRKLINGKYHNYKYWGLEIRLDAIDITYIWE